MMEKIRGFLEKRSTLILQILLALLVGYLIFTVISLTETIRSEQAEHRKQAESTLKYVELITEENKKNTENHRERNEEVHKELEDLICDIIMQRPADQITDGQRKTCADKSANRKRTAE